MPTFDIVSKLDQQEIDNALNTAKKEIATRFDFKGTGTELEREGEGLRIRADSAARVDQARAVLEDKLTKRKVSIRVLDPQKVEPAGGSTHRQIIKLKEGLSQEKAKEIVKFIKDSKLKVQGSIQGDLVRVSGKKKDDLQEAIASLRGQDFGQPLQYLNFRD